MGIFIFVLIIIGVGLAVRFGSATQEEDSRTTRTSSSGILQDFRIRIVKSSVVLDGQDIETFKLQVIGRVVGVFGDNSTLLMAVDSTGPKEKPLLTAHKIFSLENSPIFGFASNIKLPGAVASVSEWTTMCNIPIEVLMFPFRGDCKIKFTYSIGNRTSASFVYSFYNDQRGYENFDDDQKAIAVWTVRLALCISATDYTISESEQDMITDWIKNQDKAEDLQIIFDDEMSNYRDGVIRDVDSCCDEIMEKSDLSERLMIVQLCCEIMSADGILADEEADLSSVLADKLDIPLSKYQSIREKHLSLHNIEIGNLVNVANILGITSDMTVEKQKAHLRKIYKKWNALTHHPDPKTRKQAEAMVELVAEARNNLKSLET